jgi:undecaprenyl-diphosphatase
MSILQIIVLALIQGITEFLPISSSGHLILVPAFTGWPDQGVVTDMVTNLGSVSAVIIYFWRDVMAMIRGIPDLLRARMTMEARLLLNVIVGTIPITIVGALLHFSHLDELIRNPVLVAVNAIVFGALLYTADRYGLFVRTMLHMNWKAALMIGGAQALALSPGTSRSGITMTAGRALGFVRPEAARFAFLLSIPANLESSVLIIGDAVKNGQSISLDVMITGVLTFFVSLGTITVLMKLIRTHSFLPFVIYRMALGALILGLIYSGVQMGKV